MLDSKKNIRLKIVIVNHNCNQNAITLKQKFSPVSKTVLIDSGSDIKGFEAAYFDVKLENVYYNGLLNKAHELLGDDYTHLLFITSDVTIPDAMTLVNRIHQVYLKEPIGVYAPSARYSSHAHMNNGKSGGLRKVTFVEGFCFVAPKKILDQICPIDLTLNKLGHGVDIYLGYLSLKNKKYSVVDDQIVLDHPHGSGYNDKDARIQRDNWFRTKSKLARIFHYIASVDMLKNYFGFYCALLLMQKGKSLESKKQ